MLLKWKLFGIVNYLLAVFYWIVFVFAMKAFFNPESGMRHLEKAKLITLCILIIALNTVLNIFIFHRYLPAKQPGRRFKKIYALSTVLCTIAIAWLSFIVVPDIIQSLGSGETDLLPIALALLLTLPVLIIQYSLLKYIDKEFNTRIGNQIADLGSDRNDS